MDWREDGLEGGWTGGRMDWKEDGLEGGWTGGRRVHTGLYQHLGQNSDYANIGMTSPTLV